MKDVMEFNFNGNNVRTVSEKGEPWFVANDICNTLDINTNNLTSVLDSDEISNSHTMGLRIPGVNRGMRVINESGMYALVMKSRKPEAKKFRKWVTAEVLPTIRKTGGVYMTERKAEELLANPDLIIGLAKQVKEIKCQRDNAIATKAHISDKKTATALQTAGVAVRRLKKVEKDLVVSNRRADVLSLQLNKISHIRSLMRKEQERYTPYKSSINYNCAKCGGIIKNSIFGMVIHPDYNGGRWGDHVHKECFDQHVENEAVRKYGLGER